MLSYTLMTTWQVLPSAPVFTFVAPPSGSVTIGFGAMLPTYTTTTQLSYRVRLGATQNAGTVVLPEVPSGWNPVEFHGAMPQARSPEAPQWS